MTLFYIQRYPTPKEKEKLKVLLDSDDLNLLSKEIFKFLEKVPIAYTVAGWQTMFYTNEAADEAVTNRHPDTCWENNLDSIKEVTKKKNIRITDEYGTNYTFEAFWRTLSDSMFADDEHKNYHTINDHKNLEIIDSTGIRWKPKN